MNKSRKIYLDYLNVLSALSVVMLHMNGVVWEFNYGRSWITANIIENLFYFAVPVFFMISGVTLINYSDRYSTKEFLKKRFTRTFIPFIFWSLIGLIYFIHFGEIKTKDLSLLHLIDLIFNTKIVAIYWFFPPLFGLYLSMPILTNIKKEKRKDLFKYLIIVGFALICVEQFCQIAKIPFNGVTISMASGYVQYLLIGYYIDNYDIQKKNRIIIYILGILSLIFVIIAIWMTSYAVGGVDKTFKSYLSPFCILYSSALFLFFKHVQYDSLKVLNKIVFFFRNCTFGVYLLHYFVVYYLYFVLNLNRFSIYMRLFGGLAVFVAVGLLTKVLKHVPVINKLL